MKKNLPQYCVGIDGCKDGWVVVYCPALTFKKAKCQHYRKLSQLKSDFASDSIIVIDMPIGLEVNRPNRSCDIEARKFLGHRSSTVFSPPCQDAIFAKNYEEAKAINLHKTGKSISKQSWFLTKKILETKSFIEDEGTHNLMEGHPECSFTEYAGTPILENKKGMRGMFKRLDILTKLSFNLPKLVEMLPKSVGVEINDLFDATILCWTANRIFNGESKTFPRSETTNELSTNKFFINV